jgi:hypothetical protein
MLDKEKDSNKSWYDRNKEKAKRHYRLARQASQSKKTHVTVGKLKLVDLPANILDILHERFKVDETSTTGLRWSESSVNQFRCKGKEAGALIGVNRGYYYLNIIINSINYKLSVARVVWMMANNVIIEPGLWIDHRNKKRNDNRISNLQVGSAGANNVNRHYSSNSYKNICVDRRKVSHCRFRIMFRFLGKRYFTKSALTEDSAFLLGWELLTSGKVPLACIKAQSLEYLDGSDLKRALKECKKQGIAVAPPKFKTLYEYIAFVENNAN